jgi:hypothetical protein
MMKLSVMRTVCSTIQPGGRCPVVEEVLAPWDYDPGSDRFIVASSNFTASFSFRGERRIVRFVRTDERSRDQAGRELSSDDHAAHAALRKLRTSLEALPATDRNYGLIH